VVLASTSSTWTVAADAGDPGVPSLEVTVGRIGRPHGLRGEVTVDVRTDEPERRFAEGAVLTAQPPPGSRSSLTSLTVVSSRPHAGTLLVAFEEIPDRNAAEAARGIVLHSTIAADEVPEDPDEYYDHQLIGLAAYDLDGTHLGELTAVQHGSAQDLLTVLTTDGRTTLVPFVAALVPEVDLAAGRVVIADRPGLVAPFPDEDEGAQ
jgi:16S rRNA processing protein RimM